MSWSKDGHGKMLQGQTKFRNLAGNHSFVSVSDAFDSIVQTSLLC